MASNGRNRPAQSQFQSQNPTQQGDVSSCVKALLLSTKQLQDALTQWSLGQLSESQVSDVYVRIGTDFNAMVYAFAYHKIDVSEIYSIPGELRSVLEQCLGEDPSQEVLAQFVPDVRRVLARLLQGLQAKRDAWRAVSGR